jgi:hypothetical protein
MQECSFFHAVNNRNSEILRLVWNTTEKPAAWNCQSVCPSFKLVHGQYWAQTTLSGSESFSDPRGHYTSTNMRKVSRSQVGPAPLFKMFLSTKDHPTVTKKGVLWNINGEVLKCEHLNKNINFSLSVIVSMERG